MSPPFILYFGAFIMCLYYPYIPIPYRCQMEFLTKKYKYNLQKTLDEFGFI